MINEKLFNETFTKSVAIVQILGFAMGYLFLFMLAYYHSATGLGIYGFAFSILSVLGTIALLGTKEFIINDDKFSNIEERNIVFSIFSQALFYIIPVGAVISIALILLNTNLMSYFGQTDVMKYLLVTIALVLPFYIFVQITAIFFRAIKKLYFAEFFNSMGVHIFNMGALYYMMNYSHETKLNDLLNIFMYSFGTLAAVAFILVMYERYHLSLLRVSLDKLPKNVLQISLSLMISTFGISLLSGHLDIIMLGMYQPLNEVGYYVLTLAIASSSQVALVISNQLVAPKVMTYYHEKHFHPMKALVQDVGKILFFIAVIFLAIILLFPKEILGFFGETFNKDIVILTLFILAISQFISTISGSVVSMMNMTDHQKSLRNVIVVAVIAKILLNLLFIPIFGILGAAVGTLIVTIFWRFSLVFLVKQKFGVMTIFSPVSIGF